jgi:hypothetical protein
MIKYGIELLRQTAWSELQPAVGRDFERTLVAARCAFSF